MSRAGVSEGPPALVERDSELKLIDQAFRSTKQGRGCFVIVYGVAGIGRSSLLRSSVLSAGKRGIAVIEARGSELERGYAFGVVRQLLEAPIAGLSVAQRRSLLRDAELAAESALGIAHSERRPTSSAFEQIEGVYRLIARLAMMKPLLVAVDDLQWCDRPSLDLLCFLGHRANRLPVTIMAAWCRGEPGVRAGRLQALAAKPHTLFLTLAPLSKGGVRAVIERESGREPDDQGVSVIHARTGGQPWLASELAIALRLRGVPPQTGYRQAIEALTPESVRREIAARLGRHPETVQRLAAAVAVLEEGTIAQLAALTDIDLDRARTGAAALVRAGILRDDAVVAYAHPLLRAAVYDTLCSLEGADLHRRAAEVLCEGDGPNPTDSDRVAKHLLRSEPAGDPRFAQVLVEEAHRAIGLGTVGDAVRYLERALGEIEDSLARGEVLVQLAEFELRIGDLVSASAHAAEARSLASTPSACAAAAALCVETAVATSGWQSALQLLEAEEAELSGAEANLQAGLRSTAATLRACCHLPPWGSREAPDSFEGVTGDTTPEREMLAALASHMALAGAGNADRVRDLCARALAEVEEPPSETARYLACRTALLIDANDLVDGTLARGSEGQEAPEAGEWALAQLALRAQVGLARGDLPRAEADARAALGFLKELPPTALHRRIHADLLAGIVAISIERSRYRNADQALARLVEADDAPGLVVKSLRIALALAHTTSADRIDWLDGSEKELLGVAAPGVSWRAWAAVANHAAGEREKALSLATDHLEHAREWGCLSVLGRALAVRAIVDPGAARLRFIEEAVIVLERTQASLELARGTIGLGVALRRAGRRRAAREQLVRGADLAHQCGASTLSAWARSELVAVGARPRRTAFSGVASLTVSELRVARLAATGMTNREIAQKLIVSAKTVSGQLTAVYQKLDVHDRATLTAVMHEKPSLGAPLGSVG